MPQLDLVSFFPQLVWLFIVLLGFHVILSMVLLPGLNKVLLARESVPTRRGGPGTAETRYFWLFKVGITADVRPAEDLEGSTKDFHPALRPTGAAFFGASQDLSRTALVWSDRWVRGLVVALQEQTHVLKVSWATGSELSTGPVTVGAQVEDSMLFVTKPVSPTAPLFPEDWAPKTIGAPA